MASTKRSTTKGNRKQDDSLAARTGRTIKTRPYTSAAIATGAVTAVAAAVAGAFFFRRSDKSLGELGEDLSDRIAQGARTIKEKAAFMLSDDSEDSPEQSRIAEEALTLKETGRKTDRPVDPKIGNETKAGGITY